MSQDSVAIAIETPRIFLYRALSIADLPEASVFSTHLSELQQLVYSQGAVLPSVNFLVVRHTGSIGFQCVRLVTSFAVVTQCRCSSDFLDSYTTYIFTVRNVLYFLPTESE